jgi:nucleoside-diphosphate-sugar epimerase
MSLHVVAGAGSTGTPIALMLAEAGESVRLVSRSGTGPEHPLIERVSVDANDAERLTQVTEGASTLVNTTWPPYDRWPEEFPPLAAALLTTVERTGASYVMIGNTYGYGRVNGRFTEDLPMAPTTRKGRVRAQIWLDALASHEAGRSRVTEVRASAFLGAGAGSLYNMMVTAPILAGEPASFPGDLDAPKTWSYVGDVARTAVAAALDDRSWGRAWHVPSTATISVRDLSVRLTELAGAPAPQLTALSVDDLRAIAESAPVMGEVIEMYYQLEHPDLLDSTLTEQTFGLTATPFDEVLAEEVKAYSPAA